MATSDRTDFTKVYFYDDETYKQLPVSMVPATTCDGLKLVIHQHLPGGYSTVASYRYFNQVTGYDKTLESVGSSNYPTKWDMPHSADPEAAYELVCFVKH